MRNFLSQVIVGPNKDAGYLLWAFHIAFCIGGWILLGGLCWLVLASGGGHPYYRTSYPELDGTEGVGGY